MNRIQKITLAFGITGILVNAICIATGNVTLGYLANLLGRLSGLAYMVAVDKFRSEYMLPITLATVNVFVTHELLLFTEMLITATIYQLNAYRQFTKK
jgi:hypothetical protein